MAGPADALLARLDDRSTAEYLKALLAPHARLEVRLDAGGGKGKGVFATAAFEEGEEVFREPPLVRRRRRRPSTHLRSQTPSTPHFRWLSSTPRTSRTR